MSVLNKLEREIRRIGAQLRKTVLRRRIGERWSTTNTGLASREYPDYDAYLEHQRTKFDAMREKSIRGHDARFYAALTERLAALPFPLTGKAVLCLAARQGTEVRAFIDRGAFAIGIDLNPGKDNKYVVVGDFHNLQYADGSLDVVYTNSLDHAFDLPRILGEVRRVLNPDGVFVAEVGRGTENEFGRGFYEATSWKNLDELLAIFASAGFGLVRRSSFEQPWPGEQLIFSLDSRSTQNAQNPPRTR